MLIAYLGQIRQKFRNRNADDDHALSRHFDMAIQLATWGDIPAAISLLQECIIKHPYLPALHFHLGEMLRTQGDEAGAVEAYQEYLRLDDKDSYGVRIKLTLLGVRPQDDTLPLEYVRCLFDQYADSFEECLVGNLEYTTPAHVVDAVYAQGKNFKRVLDLGCGTGLSAMPFREHAGHIDGVDISAAMLEKARAKNIYNTLHHTDIASFLKSGMAAYDLVLCIDALIYLGKCEEIFRDMASAITPHGICAFTVQVSDTHDVVLGEDHRYAHGKNYIERCAHDAGMKILSCTNMVLRKEQGEPVDGMIFVCGKK